MKPNVIKFSYKVLILCLVISLMGVFLSNQSLLTANITKKNWKYHPKIKEIRRIVKRTFKDLETGEATKKEYNANLKHCKNGECKSYQFEISDKIGRTLVCGVKTLKGDKEFSTTENYFDRTGNLRFAFVKKEGDVLIRSYYTSSGKYLWGVQTKSNKVIATGNQKTQYSSGYISDSQCY